LATGAVAAAAGAALGVSFPPYGLWWLAPLSIATLFVLLYRRPPATLARSLADGALVGAVFGLMCFATVTPWLRVIGMDAYTLVVVMSLAFTALFGAGAVLILRLPGWPLWVACWWVAVEGLRSRIPFGGFPWGRVAHSQVDSPAAPWVAVGGVPLLTFVVILAAALLAWGALALIDHRPRRFALGMAGMLLVLASGMLIPTPTSGPQITVAVVQGNVPGTGMDAFGRREAVLDAHVQATQALARDVRAGLVDRPDVVIWPENASDIDPSTDRAAFDKISAAVDDVGVPVLVGLVVAVDGGEHLANEGTVWSPTSGPGDTYIKQHLVPFGEYVPFRDVLQRVVSRLDRVPRDFVAGDRPGVLQLGPATVADVICFDVAYDDAVRDAVAGGGDLITVQTNNATYGGTGQVEQQWAISRLRAVEHGRSVVVASTSGISGIIAPDGTVAERAPEFEQATIVAPVTLRTELTLATRLGFWPEAVLCLLGLAALGGSFVAEKRRRGKVEP
jgi:apolipoprotein N-acyltransferase